MRPPNQNWKLSKHRTDANFLKCLKQTSFILSSRRQGDEKLLSTILSSGNSSRLHQALVEQQLATNVFTTVPLSFDPNLFYIYAVARPGVAASTLEQALLTSQSSQANNGVTAYELEKAKNIQLMNFYREMQTINGKADNIGTYQLYFGDYRKLYQTAELFNQVSAADIQRVAARYLTRANRTVGILAANEETDQWNTLSKIS